MKDKILTDNPAERKAPSTPSSLGQKFRSIFEKKISGGMFSEKDASSKAVTNFDGRILPPVAFEKCREYGLSSPRLFNTARGLVLDVRNRDFHWNGNDHDQKLMEEWAKTAKPKTIIEKMLFNLIFCGLEIISPKDWKDLQLTTIKGMIRDDNGDPQDYIQERNGQEYKLPAADFIMVPFIQFDREAWPIGMFHSLFFNDYVDIDGKDPRPIIELHRQSTQDTMKIHHKFASPRVFYNAPDVNKETFDNDIVPILEGMGPGDRAGFNAEIKPEMETVDTTARFHESVKDIKMEMDVGAGTSKNRLITEPSAMADASEANKDDDDTIMALLDIVKQFMDEHVIPAVTGKPPGETVFEWGSKDTFNLEYPQAIKDALADGVIDHKMAQIIMVESFKWPEDIKKIEPPKPEPAPLPAPDASKAAGESLAFEMLKHSTAMLTKDIQQTQENNR